MREYMKTLLNGVKKYVDSNQPSTEECLQSDWEQNDPTTPDFIKNRTHYEEVIDGETTLTIKPGDVLEPSVIDQIWEQRETAKYECDGYPDMQFWFDNYPENGQFALYDGLKSITVVRKAANVIEFHLSDVGPTTVRVTANLRMTTTHKLDIKYIPDEVANREPLILDANLSDYYGGHAEAGDEALEAIKTGRQILVRVPNADGGTNTAIYCPIMMYQLPCNGYYLYLFYLRDEKQVIDLSAVGLGTIEMPTYGEFTMLLSETYTSDPMES